jgi:hypothetical protein
VLEYRNVRTLVRDGNLYRFATRDFTIVLLCPEGWPFERAAAPQPFVMAPDDAAHPNSDGRAFCLDLQGVLPARVPEVIYDNLRIRRFRLDHCVDHDAASFVRAHLAQMPADPRPLYEEDRPPCLDRTGGELLFEEVNQSDVASRTEEKHLPIVDVAVGTFGVSIDDRDLTVPTFLRLARSAGSIVDAARSIYLSAVDTQLRATKTGWVGGPGLLVDSLPADHAVLRRELLEVGHACAGLAEEAIARSYVSFFEERPEPPSIENRVRVALDPDTKTKGGST